MKRTTDIALGLAVILTLGGAPILARQAGEDAVLLRKAITTEVVDGDRRAAIEMYRTLADSRDPAIAADARRRLAVAEARSARAGAQAASQRAVWTGPYVDLFGQVSPDGRFLTFVDWARSMNLMVRDLEAGTERSLTNLSPVSTPGWKFHGEAEFSTVSKDGTQVAYGWVTAEGGYELRILPMSAKPGTPARTLLPVNQEIQGLRPYDWSPDGQWIVAASSLKDGSGQIVLVRVGDGSTRVMRSVTWRGPERIFFSPDGRLVAYDLPAHDDTDQRDVFVMTVDASREVRAVEHEADDRLIGWSPDGRQLVFLSDRTGSPGLFAQPFAGGRPAGDPALLRAGSGEGLSLGITRSGTLILYRPIDDLQIRRAPVNLAAAQVTGPPVAFVRGPVGGASIPDWSPDGRYLAYNDNGPMGGRGDIVIRTVATGEARTVKGLYAPQPRWSPDGRFLLGNGRDRRGRTGIYRIVVETGAIELLAEGPMGFGPMPQWSSDGTKVFARRGARVVERTVSTGAERVVFSTPGLVAFEIAPDGRQMAVRRRDPANNEGPTNVTVVSLETGEAREILPPTPGPSGTFGRSLAWTPDSSAVIVAKTDPNGPTELWLVPVTAGQTRKLEFVGEGWPGDFASNGRFALARDGRSVAWVSGTRAAEVWAIENLVPPVR